MKILHVNFLLESSQGGVPSAVANIINASSNAGIVHGVVGGVGHNVPDRLALRKFYTYADNVVVFKRCLSPKVYKNFYNWLKSYSYHYNVVHIHGLFNPFTILASRFCMRNRVPHVVSPHGMLSPYGMLHGTTRKKIWFKLFDENVLKNCNRVHVCSEIEKLFLLSYHGTSKSEVIPLPVAPRNSIESSSLIKSKVEGETSRSRRKFLFVGRLDPVKNLEYLLTSVSKLDKDSYSLTVAGDGADNYKLRLAALAAALDISKNVTFLGHVSDVGGLFRRHDVLVLPSLSESFGLVAAEAALAGLRVIVSNRVGIGSTLHDFGAAKVFDLEAESLVCVLLEEILLAKSEVNEAHVPSAVKDFFSASRVGDEFIRLYTSI